MFEFKNGDGRIIKSVFTCTECPWISTARHCKSDGDDLYCSFCGSMMEEGRSVESSDDMSSFKYRQLCDHLEEEVSGVGSSTVESIREYFDDGDDFLDATRVAYQDREWEELSAVSGVGESTAESIALGIADLRGWEGGDAEKKFSF